MKVGTFDMSVQCVENVLVCEHRVLGAEAALSTAFIA